MPHPPIWYDDDYDESDFDEDGYDPGEECGRWNNGSLTHNCSKAGSEECDWECPYRDTLYRRKPKKKDAPGSLL